MQNLFFSRTRRRTAHQYIKKQKGGVEAPGVTVMGMYRALTTDTYRLLQIDKRVGPDQKRTTKPPEGPGPGGVTLLEPRQRTTNAKSFSDRQK